MRKLCLVGVTARGSPACEPIVIRVTMELIFEIWMGARSASVAMITIRLEHVYYNRQKKSPASRGFFVSLDSA
jgi:hypothetical protein